MFKSGYIGIIGRANVGKSTLLNQILKEKLSIVTCKPHTTRASITGIYNSPEMQIVFLDTPGFHPAKNALDAALNQDIMSGILASDLLLWLVDATGYLKKSDYQIAEILKEAKAKAILVFNKLDLIKDKKAFDKLCFKYQSIYPFIDTTIISALNGENVDILLAKIKDNLDIGPKYYATDILSPDDKRLLISELIREKAILLTNDELPYAVAVNIIKMAKENDLLTIYADIICERASQKGIIIGKGGTMIKKIGTMARSDIVRFLGEKIYLELFARVDPDWRNKTAKIKEFVWQTNR